jgi:transcriptional regulator with XRE-family HTH domain
MFKDYFRLKKIITFVTKSLFMEDLHNKIKQIRKSKGLSIYDIAECTGVSHTKIANIENAKTKTVGIDMVIKIANALNVNFSDLVDIEDSSKSEELGKIKELQTENEELKVRIEEKEELIIALKSNLSSAKNIIHSLFADYCEKILTDVPIEKKYKSVPESVIFAHNMFVFLHKIGMVTNKSIDSFLLRKEGKYPNFTRWHESYKKGSSKE